VPKSMLITMGNLAIIQVNLKKIKKGKITETHREHIKTHYPVVQCTVYMSVLTEEEIQSQGIKHHGVRV
jgi:glycyl-tRNA synthetase beta subunit